MISYCQLSWSLFSQCYPAGQNMNKQVWKQQSMLTLDQDDLNQCMASLSSPGCLLMVFLTVEQCNDDMYITVTFSSTASQRSPDSWAGLWCSLTAASASQTPGWGQNGWGDLSLNSRQWDFQLSLWGPVCAGEVDAGWTLYSQQCHRHIKNSFA